MVKPVVFCGPSGSGKSTLLKMLMEDYPDKFGFSVSHTTRKPRRGEENGIHYHFVTFEQMQEDIDNDKFIESATFSGNMYGTSKLAVEDVQKLGKVCVLDIDMQGVMQVKKTSLDPWYIFLKPPSVGVLEERLRIRNSENEESLTQRLKVAAEELAYGECKGNFDIIITNDNLEDAYQELKTFVENHVLKTA